MFWVSFKVMLIRKLPVKDILNQTVHFFCVKSLSTFIYILKMLVSKVDCVFPLLNNLVFDCFLPCMAVNSMAVNSAWVPREMYISCMYIEYLGISDYMYCPGGRGVELTPLVVEMQLVYINYLMVGSRYGFYP